MSERELKTQMAKIRALNARWRSFQLLRGAEVDILAHPTGRLFGQRESYAVNLDAVFEAARTTHTALEINAYPKRLDLSDAAARKAGEQLLTWIQRKRRHAREGP